VTLALGQVVPLSSLFSLANVSATARIGFKEFGQASPTGTLVLPDAGSPFDIWIDRISSVRYIAADEPSVETVEITAQSTDSGFSGRSAPLRISITSGVLPADTVGNDRDGARSVTVGAAVQSVTEFVTKADPQDFFKLDVGSPGQLRLSLEGMGGNADLQLRASDGQTVLAQSLHLDSAGESIAYAAAAGTYYARVFSANGESTRYSFGASLAS
jgi:hypothetical protein